MRKVFSLCTLLLLLSLSLGVASAQNDTCFVEPEVMTTADGVDFVRTPDACFENLPDWPYEAQYVEIDGLRQAYVDVGTGESGETILLLHGQPSWSYLYRKMIPVLADAGHRVIAMDHVGMGRSDKPIDPDYYTYVGHVERLEIFIHELELEGITIFVQDWGSLIGLQVVGTNPEWFDRLVVGNGFLPTFPEGSTPFVLPENPEITRNLFHAAITRMPAQQEPLEREPLDIDSMAEFDTEGNFFGLWIDYARNDERFRPEVIVEAMTYFDLSPEEEAAYAAPFPSRVYMGGARAFPGLVNELPGVTDSGWAGLGEFDKPFLTIWGDNDGGNLGDPAIQQLLIDHIPGSDGWEHVRLEEASHFLQDDAGEEIARRMNDFIAQTSDTEDQSAFEGPGYRAGLYDTAFPSERVNLNGTKAVLQGGFPLGTTADDVAIELIEMPYPVLLYTREPDEIFVFGGTPIVIEDYVSRADGLPTGDNEASPYLAKVNTASGEITYLDLDRGRGLPYLGGALVHANGYVYVVSQVHLYKVEPETMTIEASVDLPSVGFGTIYNGLATSSTGELILKSLSATGGTQKIVLIDPTTLDTTFSMDCECASPRLTVSMLANGEEYLYHLNQEQTFRWLIEPGSLTLDEDWIVSFDPTGLGVGMNDEPTSPVIVGDTVYYTTNTNTDATTPMRVFWQDTEAAYTPDMPALTGPLLFEGVEDIAGWSFTGLSGDDVSGVLFANDQANGLFMAFRLTEDGEIERLWQREITTAQTTTSSENGMLYVADFADGVLNLVVLDVLTGEELLRIPTPAVRASIGSIIFTENGDVYLAANEPGQPTGFLVRFYIPNEFIAQSPAETSMGAVIEDEEEEIGYEILQIVSPNEIITWVNVDGITQAEFDAIDLPLGWFKNQPREVIPSGGTFAQSPSAEADGEFVEETLYGHQWRHVATIVEANVPLDDEGLLTANTINKFHQVEFSAGTTLPVLVSPEGDGYALITRDAGRTTDTFALPDGWQLTEITLTEDLVVQLPNPTINIRTENEDSFQGPVGELVGLIGAAEQGGSDDEGLQDDVIPAIEQTQFMPPPEDLRNFRYCEILIAVAGNGGIRVSVFNTMGLSDCPAEQWAEIDTDAITEAYDLLGAIRNGPRYWVVNEIVSPSGLSSTGQVSEFNGLEMRLVAQINATPAQAASMSLAPYSQQEVIRDTIYTYNAGSRVYELVSPGGDIYRMQSYSQEVDSTLTIDDLETLGERLELPDGWSFQTHILEEDSFLTADGIAYLVSDELNNAYQLITTETVPEETLVPGSNDTGLYTTVNAAEHADDGRSHVFQYATFGGSLDEGATNRTVIRTTPGFYPGAYNVVTRNENEIFVYYGVYGEVEGATGPAVARLDADTLEEVWNVQLAVIDNGTGWNYPGVIGMHGNGTLIVVSANTAAVIDPDTGDIINQVELPQDDPVNGSYNGFTTTSDGTLFTKALFRNCDAEGSVALSQCLDTDITQILLALDPVTLEIIDQVELPDFSTGRVPTAVHDGVDYVYMPGVNFSYRYRWENQTLILDEDWGFVSITEEDDMGAMAPNVIGNWVFVSVNTGTPKPMPVWAISTIDPSERFLIRPFEDIETRFSFAVAHGAYDISSDLLLTADTGTGWITAMRFDPETGFEVIWREEQTTSVFMQLIGSPEERVMVTSELIDFRLNPLAATYEQVVFRDVATGHELARTENLPRMTQGSNISPGFGGRVYFIGVDGVLYEITVESD